MKKEGISLVYILVLIASLFILFYFLWIKKAKLNDAELDYSEPAILPMRPGMEDEKIEKAFKMNDSQFDVNGNSKEFIIKKDNRFEFLVKNGVIVACKDMQKHTDFIFYEEVKK